MPHLPALLPDPDLMMFDEPFAGQDPISMGVILSLIKRLNEALNLTSIVVSHDVQEVLSIADYAYIIADKHVIAEGTSEQLLASQDPQVTQFLQDKRTAQYISIIRHKIILRSCLNVSQFHFSPRTQCH